MGQTQASSGACPPVGCKLKSGMRCTVNAEKRLVLLTDLPGFKVRPLEAFDIHTDRGKSGEDNDCFDAGLLPLVVFGLRGPVEEGHDVLGHLCGRSGGA